MNNFGGGFKFNTGGNTGGQGNTTGNTGFGFSFSNQGQNQQPAFGQAQNVGATTQSPISSILQGYKYILQNGQNQGDSVFSCVLFNYCPPELRNDYLRDEKNRELYNRYLSENPDPDNMVPVTVYGFNGLKERIESQKQILKSFADNDMLQQVVASSHAMIAECDRLARECDEKQSRLEEQMIRVLGKIESTSAKSQVVVTNEEFMQKLVKLQREVSQATYPSIHSFI